MSTLPLAVSGVLFLLELLVYFVFPKALARIAFFPLAATRVARIPQAWLDAKQTEAGYRRSARSGITLYDLPIPTSVSGHTCAGGWDGGFGWLQLKPAGRRSFALAVARLQARLDAHRVVLSSRGYPCPLSPVFLLVALHGDTGTVLPLLLASLGLPIVWVLGILRIRADVNATFIRVASDIERLRPGD